MLGGTIWQIIGNANLRWLLSPIYAAIAIILTTAFKTTDRKRPINREGFEGRVISKRRPLLLT